MSEKHPTHEDLETMEHGFSLAVGQLNPTELEAFNRLCASGFAYRSYEGALGFMGIALAKRTFPR